MWTKQLKVSQRPVTITKPFSHEYLRHESLKPQMSCPQETILMRGFPLTHPYCANGDGNKRTEESDTQAFQLVIWKNSNNIIKVLE